jgi:hypothetical protein
MNRTWPSNGDGHIQSVELRRAEISPGDREESYGLTMAMGR